MAVEGNCGLKLSKLCLFPVESLKPRNEELEEVMDGARVGM